MTKFKKGDLVRLKNYPKARPRIVSGCSKHYVFVFTEGTKETYGGGTHAYGKLNEVEFENLKDRENAQTKTR